MVDDPRDAADARDALAEAFEEPAARPVATRTRVPPSVDREADADAAEPADDREEAPENDRRESVDEDPIHPRTRTS
ncbi:hypothetical protein [Halorubrum sodomense]|uniref:Uncharacterized protein n=1 Tax=Halorubrum sodomense TaxID=35743 RepID=A0A1I6FLF1_HALSD|nr:hypothetical protein [Halorubrum sodomense]SFR30772.1 hypothetical protein SAMN04487937_0602 [Halorubrum sodomense]